MFSSNRLLVESIPSVIEEDRDAEGIPAVYVNLETGNPIIDRYFYKTWIASGIVIAGLAAYLAYNKVINSEFTSTKATLEELWPNIASACCCAPALFPFATYIWAICRDLKN